MLISEIKAEIANFASDFAANFCSGVSGSLYRDDSHEDTPRFLDRATNRDRVFHATCVEALMAANCCWGPGLARTHQLEIPNRRGRVARPSP